jgi:long-chain acyl-CoA synthetase
MESRSWHRFYDPGVPAGLEYEELALPRYLERAAERVPDRAAVVFQNARLSYRQLAGEVDRLASGFAGLGVGPGSSVAIQLPNLPQTVIAYYAALSLGARVVLTNPLYTGREIVHQWTDAECDLAVTTDFLWDQRVRALRDQLTVKAYVIASIPEYLAWPLSWLAPLKLKKANPPAIARVADEPGVHRFKALVRASSSTPPRPEIDLDDLAVLQYTGGTTGVSKGAMLTHRNLSANAQQTVAWFSDSDYGREVVLTCLPLFHVFGMTVCMNLGVLSGGTLVLIPNPRDVKSLVTGIAKHRATIFPGVPALFNALNHFPGIDGTDLTSVRYCVSGSAPIAPDVLERFEGLTGATIIEGFGMSETSPLTHANPLRGDRRIGSIGIPVSDTDARVVDVDDPAKELPHGEEGELVLRGPQVMKGYWKRDDETAKTMHGEWLRTGDLATRDEDGYFRIVGRKKDMINASGLKVFPDEIDAVLVAHDAILEAATIGVPHEKRGETVKSFVVLQPGATLSGEEVEAYCRENLAAYKVPREIEFLDELPKSSVLKVLRRELRDRELAKREAAAGA